MDHDAEHDWLGDVDFDNSEFISSKTQFGGPSVKPTRLSTSLNEDTYDYALLLVPDDEYRQAAASLPKISEYDDVDEELLLYGGAVRPRNSPQKPSHRDPHHRLSRAFLAAVRQSFGSSSSRRSSSVSSLWGQHRAENEAVVTAVPDVEQGGIQQHTSPAVLQHQTASDTPSPASSLSSASVICSHHRGGRGVSGVCVSGVSGGSGARQSKQRSNNNHSRISPEQSMSQSQVIPLSHYNITPPLIKYACLLPFIVYTL